jgi:hypothetical protein
MSTFPLQALLDEMVAFLEERRVDYLVMGGVAVRFWGIPRPTYDLDFTLAIPPERVPGLCDALRDRGFTIPEIHEKGFVDRLAGMDKVAVARILDGREVRVDLFLVTTRYQREAFGRRVRKAINGGEAWLIAPEDLILHKLIAGRERDLADITDVLWMNPNADKAYLRKWAGELGVSATLEKKLDEPLP